MAFTIHIAGTEQRFACEPGQNILDAGLKSGIEMPYSCRKGVCGNCAGGIAQGEVDCPPSDMTEPGQHLYCQCVPRGDLEIVPTTWHRIDPAARKTFKVKVFRNTLAAEDVSLLQLRLPTGQRAKFKAGQYLQVALPDGSKRSYSMANPPHESDSLQLHIRHVAGGEFTRIVPTLKAGDVLEVELPYGNFELRENASAPMLCVVGGTGFAPVKSLLDDMTKKRITRPVTLIWGGRNTAGIYLVSAVERWQKMLPGFHFIPAVEDAADARTLGGFEGRVDDAVRSTFNSLASHEVYCCGAPPYGDRRKEGLRRRAGLGPGALLQRRLRARAGGAVADESQAGYADRASRGFNGRDKSQDRRSCAVTRPTNSTGDNKFAMSSHVAPTIYDCSDIHTGVSQCEKER